MKIHKTGARKLAINKPYLLQMAYGIISPKKSNTVIEITSEITGVTSSSSKSGSASMQRALKKRIAHNSIWRSSSNLLTRLAAFYSYLVPLRSNVYKRNGSIPNKPIFKPEQIAAIIIIIISPKMISTYSKVGIWGGSCGSSLKLILYKKRKLVRWYTRIIWSNNKLGK